MIVFQKLVDSWSDLWEIFMGGIWTILRISLGVVFLFPQRSDVYNRPAGSKTTATETFEAWRLSLLVSDSWKFSNAGGWEQKTQTVWHQSHPAYAKELRLYDDDRMKSRFSSPLEMLVDMATWWHNGNSTTEKNGSKISEVINQIQLFDRMILNQVRLESSPISTEVKHATEYGRLWDDTEATWAKWTLFRSSQKGRIANSEVSNWQKFYWTKKEDVWYINELFNRIIQQHSILHICHGVFFILTSPKCSSWPLWPSFHDQVVGVYWYGSSLVGGWFLWEGFGPETSKVLDRSRYYCFHFSGYILCKQKIPLFWIFHLIHLSTNQATAMTATFSHQKWRGFCDLAKDAMQTPESWQFFSLRSNRMCLPVVLGVENLELVRCPGFSWIFVGTFFHVCCCRMVHASKKSHCCGSKSGKMGLNGSHRFQRRFLIQKNLVWSEISLPLGEKLVVFAWW